MPLALLSTKPFSGIRGSGTVMSVVKFRRLSVDRCMLIWLIEGYPFRQLIRTFPLDFREAEKPGRVSCAFA